MHAVERRAEEPGNQPSPATMHAVEWRAEEPGNQPSPATMRAAHADHRERDPGVMSRAGCRP